MKWVDATAYMTNRIGRRTFTVRLSTEVSWRCDADQKSVGLIQTSVGKPTYLYRCRWLRGEVQTWRLAGFFMKYTVDQP